MSIILETAQNIIRRSESELDRIAQRIDQALIKRHQHVEMSAIEPAYRDGEVIPNTLHIGLIEVHEDHRGKGLYQAYKRDLIALADQYQVDLTTYPTDEFGSSTKRLIAHNRSLGFEGPDKDGRMLRRHKAPENVTEAASFSKSMPVNTNGRLVPRKLTGIVYHGSSGHGVDEWFDTLNVHDEAAAVWVTPDEAIAKRFSQGHGKEGIIFINRYKLKGMKTAELDQQAYNRMAEREDFDSDMDMREALAGFLASKGYDAWLTTGSISGVTYEDIAIFSGSEDEAEYDGTSFLIKGQWLPYQYFYDEDEVQEFLKKHAASI